MADDRDDAVHKDVQVPRGVRKDGKPYADNNTREDGSFEVGFKRTPTATRFAKDDGRERGRRARGTKNVLTDWREELGTKMTVSENGKTTKITKQRALIKAKIDRGIRKSDRAAEIALRYAEMSEKREPGPQADDLAIIAAWFAGMQQVGDSDDRDDPTALLEADGEDETLKRGDSRE